MKRWLLLFLLVPTALQAETLNQTINSVRMLLLDRGTPKAYHDSVYIYHIKHAVQYVGVRSLAIAVDTTLGMADGTLLYTLTRRPLRMITAYFQHGQERGNVPRVPHQDMWKKAINDADAYSSGPGKNIFVTQFLSERDSLHVHFLTEPLAVAVDSATPIDLPDGLLPAMHYQTAADILEATRVPGNLAAAEKWRARADDLVQAYLVAVRGQEADSLAFSK